MINVFCRRETDSAIIPAKAHQSDAAYDLYADEDVLLKSGDVATIKTGVSLQTPDDMCAFVLSRSGLAANSGVFVLNAPGLIDSGYRGELMVILKNYGTEDFQINHGDRIAQLMFTNVPSVALRATLDLLSDSDRGTNGLGSTGVRLLHEDEDDVPVAPA